MGTYLLRQYVHICSTPDATVLLNLRADRYHGLDREQARALASQVQGWPRSIDTGEVDEHAAAQLADELACQGLLTRDAAHGKSAVPLQLPQVVSRLHEWDGERWPEIRAAHLLRFSIAYARAIFYLRFRSLERTVQCVRLRKTARADQSSLDIETTRELMNVFRTLRPFFYTALDRCLLDSLVLVEFLALHSVFPTWVVGVKTVPFAAHSWVQMQNYVLNGYVGYVCAYQPILAV